MGGHLLAVDDSLTIRKLLELALRGVGYDLDLASSAREALEAVARRTPQLVLLDYVLPDRKGVEVCAELCARPATSQIPVIVMSARSEGMSQLFAPFPNVVAFIPKPFTPATIVHAVTLALGVSASRPTERLGAEGGESPAVATHADRGADPPSTTIRQRRAQGQLLAKQVYAILRDGLSRVPTWCDELQGQAPAPFFASRLLTPEIMERMLQALRSPPAPRCILAGTTRLIDLPRLIDLLEASCATGELWLGEESGPATVVFCITGTVVLISTTSPDAYLQDLGREPPAEQPLQDAMALQRRSAKPVPVSLHELGLIALRDPPAALRALGMRTALACMDQGPIAFRLRERPVQEPWLGRYGSRITAEMLTLERLRQVDDWTQVETQVPNLQTVFARTPGCSRLLGRLDLDATERQVLMVLDGRSDVSRLVERSRVTPFEVFHALHRLARTGLIAARTGAAATILLCEPDREAVAEPLAAHLRQRGLAVEMLADPAQAMAQILALRPRAVVLAQGAEPGLCALARAVRGEVEVSDTVLVALLAPDGADPGLAAAGFDAVLRKPIVLAELIPHLAA